MGKPYIKDRTPVGSESLCKTCSYAHIMNGYRESERITMCSEVNPNIVVQFLIYECNSYHDKNRPNYDQMQRLAIDVATGPIKPVGFKVGIGFQEAATARIPDDQPGDKDEE